VARQAKVILQFNKVNLFVSYFLFVFWYHSPNLLDTPRTFVMRRVKYLIYTFLNTSNLPSKQAKIPLYYDDIPVKE
jgi:hypothetical protein